MISKCTKTSVNQYCIQYIYQTYYILNTTVAKEIFPTFSWVLNIKIEIIVQTTLSCGQSVVIALYIYVCFRAWFNVPLSWTIWFSSNTSFRRTKLDSWLFCSWWCTKLVRITVCDVESKLLSLNMKKCLKPSSSFCFTCVARVVLKAVRKH